jgi:hypothetical protein
MTTATKAVTFAAVKHAVARQFESMKEHQLYRTDATRDDLWERYLAAFPAGTNPTYRQRTEHDCSCCRHFVKTLGGVVAVADGAVVTIWDAPRGEAPELGFYRDVLDRMAEFVRGRAIDNLFLHSEPTAGADKTFEQIVSGDSATRRWDHFYAVLPASSVADKARIGPRLAEARATHDVLRRGLEELTLEAVDTVLDLVAQNSLYRGEEHKAVLTEFWRLKVGMGAIYERTRHEVVSPAIEAVCANYVWSNIDSFAARIRNTAIGTLLIDLSGTTKECAVAGCACHEGEYKHAVPPLDLEDAVRKFETSVMAPANYKRPTALVTKAMVEKARRTIDELGYASALERRYAVLDDVSVANVLFADRAARGAMRPARKDGSRQADPFGDILSKLPEGGARLDRAEEVPVDRFLAEVLPRARGLEVLFENRHAGNLVSLVAPVDPGAKHLFKWPNGFSWSYAGDVADSIKERVKAKGGNVAGVVRASLAWFNYDDLDLHMLEPGGNRIYYGARVSPSTGGVLDVDMNPGGGTAHHAAAAPARYSRAAVENISYASKARMTPGAYKLMVNNYAKAETSDPGFEVELELDGAVRSFAYAKALRARETVAVAEFVWDGKEFVLTASLPESKASRELWGMTTQTFRKVDLVCFSPNYWERAGAPDGFLSSSGRGGYEHRGVGNRHLFFLLEGARNADGARPFYNEFLGRGLDPHGKTLEMVGARLRTEGSDRQLSGLGFSSTKRDSVTVRVTGAVDRVVKVVF